MDLLLLKNKTDQITLLDRVLRKAFSANPGLVSMTTNMLLLCFVNVM